MFRLKGGEVVITQLILFLFIKEDAVLTTSFIQNILESGKKKLDLIKSFK